MARAAHGEPSGVDPGGQRRHSYPRDVPADIPDGEVLAREDGAFPGYRNPADDASAFVDGSFATGHLGSLDAHGRLTLHGRSKDVIVTANGKNVSPANWEQRFEHDRRIAHAAMVGEGRPYLAALIVVESDAVAPASWARSPTRDAGRHRACGRGLQRPLRARRAGSPAATSPPARG